MITTTQLHIDYIAILMCSLTELFTNVTVTQYSKDIDQRHISDKYFFSNSPKTHLVLQRNDKHET